MMTTNDPNFIGFALANPQEAAPILVAGIEAKDPAATQAITELYRRMSTQGDQQAMAAVMAVEEHAGNRAEPMAPAHAAGGRGGAHHRAARTTAPYQMSAQQVQASAQAQGQGQGRGQWQGQPGGSSSSASASPDDGGDGGGDDTGDDATAGHSLPHPGQPDADPWNWENDEAAGAAVAGNEGEAMAQDPMGTMIGHSSLRQWLKSIQLHEEADAWVGTLRALAAGSIPPDEMAQDEAIDHLYSHAFPVCLTTHADLAKLRAIAQAHGEPVTDDDLHRAAIHKIAKVIGHVLRGNGFIVPMCGGQPCVSDERVGNSPAVGAATLREWLKAIEFHEEADAWVGCLTAHVCAAQLTGDVAAFVKAHGADVVICVKVPLADLRELAQDAGASTEGADDVLHKSAVRLILAVFTNILHGEGFIQPVTSGDAAAGRGFDLWADLIKPATSAALSLTVGPAAAQAVVGTVDQFAHHAPAHPSAPAPGVPQGTVNVAHVAAQAAQGDPAAQQAQALLLATQAAKNKADALQAKANAKAQTASNMSGPALVRAEQDTGTVTITVQPGRGGGTPAASQPVDTRYKPPILAAGYGVYGVPALATRSRLAAQESDQPETFAGFGIHRPWKPPVLAR